MTEFDSELLKLRLRHPEEDLRVHVRSTRRFGSGRFQRWHGGCGGGDCGGGCGEGVAAHDHARDGNGEDEVVKHSNGIGCCRHHIFEDQTEDTKSKRKPFLLRLKPLLRQEVKLVLVSKRISRKDGTQFECRRKNRHALFNLNVDFSRCFD